MSLNIFLAVETLDRVIFEGFSFLRHERLNQVVFFRYHLLEVMIQFVLFEQVLSLHPFLSKAINLLFQVGDLDSLFRDHLLHVYKFLH